MPCNVLFSADLGEFFRTAHVQQKGLCRLVAKDNFIRSADICASCGCSGSQPEADMRTARQQVVCAKLEPVECSNVRLWLMQILKQNGT